MLSSLRSELSSDREVNRWINVSVKLFSKLATVFSKLSSSAISVTCSATTCQSHRGAHNCPHASAGSTDITPPKTVIKCQPAVGEKCMRDPKRCQSANAPIIKDINYSAWRSSMAQTISGYFSINSCLKTSSRLQVSKNFRAEE